MSDIFDYITWRGDLTLGNAPICPVDTLLFSMLPYIRLEGYVPAAVNADPVRLADAVNAYLNAPLERAATEQKHEPFLRKVAASARFAPLRLLGAVEELDKEKGLQFAAITYLLPGQNLFVAFEGTDDTLIGWEEDFRMSYECPIPAQQQAAEYLREVALAFPLRRIYVGGHSKGGNLATYAAVFGGDFLLWH